MIDNINWKFVAATAIIAMAVSLLSGGLGGVPFGVLVLRAVIGAFVFLVLGIGINLVLNRYFPELWEDTTDESHESDTVSEADRKAPGGRVDIVLPAEHPEVPGNGEIEELDGEEPEDDVEELKETATEEEAPLDNLDSFSGTFVEVDNEESGAVSSSSSSGGDHNPAEIAQAIHTVIERDEKG